MQGRIWNRENIIDSILAEANQGQPLNYSSVQERVPSLLRAAERVFSSWAAAVECAGFDYSQIRRYQVWTRERVIERILYWHDKGEDLSWRYVATKLDPPLAAAALHSHRFESWSEALQAAGLVPEEVSRYRHWTLSNINQEIERLTELGIPLNQESLIRVAPDLRAAIYRVEGGLASQREALRRQQAAHEPSYA